MRLTEPGVAIAAYRSAAELRADAALDPIAATAARLRVKGGEGSAGSVPAQIYNVGNHRPEQLMRVVALLEQEFGREANKEMLPMQPVHFKKLILRWKMATVLPLRPKVVLRKIHLIYAILKVALSV